MFIEGARKSSLYKFHLVKHDSFHKRILLEVYKICH